jgi:hypothetical protein
VRADGWYRRELAAVLTGRALRASIARAAAGPAARAQAPDQEGAALR